MEIELEDTRPYIVNVPLDQTYTTLHKTLEARPGLRNTVLHEIPGLVISLEEQRDE